MPRITLWAGRVFLLRNTNRGKRSGNIFTYRISGKRTTMQKADSEPFKAMLVTSMPCRSHCGLRNKNYSNDKVPDPSKVFFYEATGRSSL